MNTPPPTLLRSVGTVGGFTLLSRLLGLVRDVLMAHTFSTQLVSSAFYLAFTIPNLFRRLFGEGALSAAFVPVFVETRSARGEEAGWRLGGKVLCLLALTLGGLVLLAEFGLWVATDRVADEKTGLVIQLTRIMLPYMIFICLVAMCMGMLNSLQHFLVPAASPCLLNLCWIASLLFFASKAERPIFAVAWAVLLAGFLQLVVQFPALRRKGFRFYPSLDRQDAGVQRIIRLMLPAAVGAAVTQVNVLIDRLLAWTVADYAVSALSFSERLIYLPLGLFATAFGTVLLPTFSTQVVENDVSRMRDTLLRSLRSLLFLMIPASVGLFVLARSVVQMIFEGGDFGAESTTQTMIALRCYAPGLLVFSLAKVFVPAFYSMQDTKTPVKIAAGCVLLNLVLNLIFINTWPEGTRHGGLAFATVIAEAVYGLLLGWYLRRRIGLSFGAVWISGAKILAAALVMGLACWWMQFWFEPVEGSKWSQIVSTLSLVGLGGMVYLVTAWLIQCRELQELRAAVRK